MHKLINRARLELTQYGYTPSGILERYKFRETPKILANSIPKSGTNVLLRTLYLIPGLRRKLHKTLVQNSKDTSKVICSLRKGEICSSHIKYTKELSILIGNRGIKHIIIIRDPRDIVVSSAMYITYKDKRHRLNDYFINKLNTDEERITASILGISGEQIGDGVDSLSMLEHIKGYLAWMQDNGCLFVKFEDLIGSKGGGTDFLQEKVLDKMLDFLEMEIPEKTKKHIMRNIFNPGSRTFVKGQIGGWKNILTQHQIGLLKERLGTYILDLGYEKSSDW
jgi:hypothetical protein